MKKINEVDRLFVVFSSDMCNMMSAYEYADIVEYGEDQVIVGVEDLAAETYEKYNLGKDDMIIIYNNDDQVLESDDIMSFINTAQSCGHDVYTAFKVSHPEFTSVECIKEARDGEETVYLLTHK